MNTTFKIIGPAGNMPNGGQRQTVGTVFFLAIPFAKNPKDGDTVLITAAHVLDEIVGDNATLLLRSKDNVGMYQAVPVPVKIRDKGKNLYVRHPTSDVAAMYVPLPAVPVLAVVPIEYLATDERIQNLDLEPGDELLCLGFPLNIGQDTFPVIRSGLLASYPLLPSKLIKTYYYNFHVFPGNSGGPVYYHFINRTAHGAVYMGSKFEGIIGLVSQQVTSTLPGYENAPMDMAVIVPSTFIAETIAMLPPRP